MVKIMKGTIKNMAWYWIVLMIVAGLWLLTLGIYWFNLDNKMIYYLVRPILNKNYDKQERDVRL